MKPVTWRVTAAVCLAVLAGSFADLRAFAAGPSFAFHPPTFHPSVGQRPPQPMHGVANVPVRRPGFNRFSKRIVRRFVPVFAGYAGYAPYYEESVSPPAFIETETPVNVNIGLPAGAYAEPPVCGGPLIIELKPKKKPAHLPRVIYGTPSACVATLTHGGPAIHALD